jgi:glycosyltransferase involved in cell wall biosynthesis
VYWLTFPYPEAWLDEARSPVARHPWVSWLRGQVARFLLYKVILPHSDLVFVQSVGMRDSIAAKGVPTGHMIPVPMGVGAQLLASRDGPRSAAVVSPSVLYLGSMVRPRHLELIVEAFRAVVEVVPTATLYLVGGENESDVDFLRAEARKHGIDGRVVFTGVLPREEALGYVRAADVCLSPIYPTPIFDVASPTKLVEYMAVARPVVANEHPEQAQVIRESAGGVVVPWTPEGFASGIVELLRDPARAAEMGRKGRQYVERHRSYPLIAEGVERAYRSRLSL